MGVTLGSVIRIEDGPRTERSSGFAGDSDWCGDSGRFIGAAGGLDFTVSELTEPEEIPLEAPTRTIWIRMLGPEERKSTPENRAKTYWIIPRCRMAPTGSTLKELGRLKSIVT